MVKGNQLFSPIQTRIFPVPKTGVQACGHQPALHSGILFDNY